MFAAQDAAYQLCIKFVAKNQGVAPVSYSRECTVSYLSLFNSFSLHLPHFRTVTLDSI